MSTTITHEEIANSLTRSEKSLLLAFYFNLQATEYSLIVCLNKYDTSLIQLKNFDLATELDTVRHPDAYAITSLGCMVARSILMQFCNENHK